MKKREREKVHKCCLMLHMGQETMNINWEEQSSDDTRIRAAAPRDWKLHWKSDHNGRSLFFLHVRNAPIMVTLTCIRVPIYLVFACLLGCVKVTIYFPLHCLAHSQRGQGVKSHCPVSDAVGTVCGGTECVEWLASFWVSVRTQDQSCWKLAKVTFGITR